MEERGLYNKIMVAIDTGVSAWQAGDDTEAFNQLLCFIAVSPSKSGRLYWEKEQSRGQEYIFLIILYLVSSQGAHLDEDCKTCTGFDHNL